MPRKDIELIGSPGVIRDTPAHKMVDSAFTDAKNVSFGEKGPASLSGDLEVLSAAAITPLWLGVFPPLGAPVWAYGHLTEMHTVQGTTHTEITRISGDYAGIATERWQATVFNGVGVFNNAVDIPQSWPDFDPTAKLIDLPNWDVNRRCKSLRSFKNFLIALNMTDTGVDRPYRVLWSDSADTGTVPGSWDSTDPTTDSREVDLASTSDHLVDQLQMGDMNIIYKEHSTWGMQYIGPPWYFRFWKILSKRGLLQRDCVVAVPFGHVVVTQDDIIVHSGQIEQSQSILTAKQRTSLFAQIDTTYFYNSFLLADPTNNQVYFCYPETGQTYASAALIWNYQDKSLGTKALTSTPFGASGPIGSSLIDDPEWGV